MLLPKRDTQHHTYADYLTWPDDQRNELINGVAYVREPPAPSRLHQEFVGELYRQVANALQGTSSRAYVAPFDVRLPKAGEADEQIDTVVQPDVLIVCDRRKLDERGMRGAPDWVAEVLSPSTASHDEVVKLPAYERAGVPEVWLIHPTDRTLSIYRFEGGRYGPARIQELRGTTPIAAVPGVSIDWDRLLANVA
jgi:Uma2 family endonuclease